MFEKLMEFIKVPNKPSAMPMRPFCEKDSYTWDDWHRDAKQAYPVRYFLTETIEDFYRRNVYYHIRRIKRDFVSRYVRKDHMLDLRQPDYKFGWLDGVTKIPYANYNILKDFIEKEHGGIENFLEFIELQEKHNTAKPGTPDGRRGLVEIYNWITIGRPRMLKEIDEAGSRWDNKFQENVALNEGVTSKLKEPEEKQLLDDWKALEAEFEKKETEMLTKLIELRFFLWC